MPFHFGVSHVSAYQAIRVNVMYQGFVSNENSGTFTDRAQVTRTVRVAPIVYGTVSATKSIKLNA